MEDTERRKTLVLCPKGVRQHRGADLLQALALHSKKEKGYLELFRWEREESSEWPHQQMLSVFKRVQDDFCLLLQLYHQVWRTALFIPDAAPEGEGGVRGRRRGLGRETRLRICVRQPVVARTSKKHRVTPNVFIIKPARGTKHTLT